VDTDPVIWEHYGDIASSLNLLSEARKGYGKSLENEGENADTVRIKLNSLGRVR